MESHRTRLAPFVVVTVLALSASSAQAISSYRTRVPNGVTASCRTCHTNTLGGEGWNAFGKDVLRQETDPDANPATDQNCSTAACLDGGGTAFVGPPDWSLDDFTLCETDSDGDGQTNGQELGDPNCVWTFTSPATPAPRTTSISNPGDAESTSDNPDGVNGAGEGEGEEGEGEEGEGEEGEGEEGEGEGEGEDPPPGCCSSGNVGAPLAGLVGFIALVGARRRSGRSGRGSGKS
jgi:hypothetical protein